MQSGDPLRVMQVVTTMSHGGAQLTVLEGARAASDEVEVVVVAGDDDLGEGSVRPELEDSPAQLLVLESLHRRIRPIADLMALRALLLTIRRLDPDVVHTHSAKAGVLGRIAAWIAGVPCVHTVHGWGSLSVASPATGVWKMVERCLARITTTLIVVTEMDAEQGLSWGIGRPDQYTVVRSGIDLSIGASARAGRDDIRRDGLGVPHGAFVVGTIGRLSSQRNLKVLIEAFALMPEPAQSNTSEAMLVIVGDGPQRELLEDRASELGIGGRTLFLGAKPDAAELVAGFDVFVSTSLWEGLPRAVLEAMSAGVPVVATPVGGVAEVVHDRRTGVLIQTDSEDDAARALGELWLDPELRERLSSEAATQLSQFGVDEMRHRLIGEWLRAAARPVADSSKQTAGESHELVS